MTRLLEFDEVEPDTDCICPGCNARRRARLHAAAVQDGGHAAAHSVRRRAAVLFAAVGTVLGGGAAAAAVPTPSSSTPAPRTPQGEVTGRFGGDPAGGAARLQAVQGITREQIIARAQGWVDQKVPYSMSTYWSDGYRQDCSGYVSMAWGLAASETTWTLPGLADRITKDELQPGDVLIFNNPSNPQAGSHVTIFGGWADAARTSYLAYEQTSPTTTRRTTPYAYWSNSSGYLPYRYKALSPGGTDGGTDPGTGTGTDPGTGTGTGTSSDGTAQGTAFPGADKFGPGRSNEYITRLGQMLVQRGGGRFYSEGPGPTWGEADRKATEAFQLAQGWTGAEADGLPGRDTWDFLVNGKGKNIGGGSPPPPVTPPTTTPPTTPPTTTPPATGVPAFPGVDKFAPGQSNSYVQQLGEQLVRKGFGRYYSQGPGPRWSESDRLNTRAFQLSLGWSGDEADGYPGPDTWRRLFG
ncbi:peptidoglycan-binding protein [Kitasatospora indigofera]|uniref:peptidoglycan-binding protein n=1 Tax=Kitasatospora indigofera TaxID=67307 RepID=UPI0036AAFEBA